MTFGMLARILADGILLSAVSGALTVLVLLE